MEEGNDIPEEMLDELFSDRPPLGSAFPYRNSILMERPETLAMRSVQFKTLLAESTFSWKSKMSTGDGIKNTNKSGFRRAVGHITNPFREPAATNPPRYSALLNVDLSARTYQHWENHRASKIEVKEELYQRGTEPCTPYRTLFRSNMPRLVKCCGMPLKATHKSHLRVARDGSCAYEKRSGDGG